MKYRYLIISVLFAWALTSAAGCASPENLSLKRAKSTMEALYANYGVEESFLLRENCPFDDGYKAGYLASEDNSSRPNPYSYLWPFSGSLSATVAIMESDPHFVKNLKGRVLPGLEEYLDTKRKPEAYASYICSAGPSDRFYDDNIWLGIDFTDLYLLTRDQEYLDKAEMIWRFIESGMDDVLGGGIYWCEQKKHSKNACSNAPGAVFALKLYLATGDGDYLRKGIGLYEWTRNTLLDKSDNLYFDNIGLDGRITEWKFAYNSGQMIQAGALLYRITGEEHYLTEAQETAKSCHGFFFMDYTCPDRIVRRVLKPGNIWFHAVMVRGLAELYSIDGNSAYIDSVDESLDLAWECSRSEDGLFFDDVTGERKSETKWVLVQSAMAEMYARMASLKNNNENF